MKVVRELQREILDETVSLSSALRKAKVLAAKVGNPQFKAWIEAELEGYQGPSLGVPPYRVLDSPSLGTFSGPFGSGMRNAVIPVQGFPKELKEYATRLRIARGVRELEALAKMGSARRRWAAESVQLANYYIDSPYELIDAFQPITAAAVEGILDSVRNRLLDFILELQNLDPDVADNDDALRNLPPDKVASSFNLTIYGNQNVVAAAASGGTTSQQVYQRQVAVGDTRALGDHLRSMGVSEAAVEKLNTAIREDGPPNEPGRFGPKVRRWIGEMTEKVLEGGWRVALETAPSVLTKALAAYYGWDRD